MLFELKSKFSLIDCMSAVFLLNQGLLVWFAFGYVFGIECVAMLCNVDIG